MSTDDATSPKLRVVSKAANTATGSPLTITVHTRPRVPHGDEQRARDDFPKTQWTLLKLAASGDAEALGQICQIYWYPVYAYIRRTRADADAADLTQLFFEMVIGTDALGRPDREKGAFRAWLRGTIKNFLRKDWRYRMAMQRDFRVEVHLDALTAEKRYALEASTNVSPERMFDRNMTLTFIHHVRERMRAEFRGDDRLFDQLMQYLSKAEVEANAYGRIASEFGLTVDAVKQRVHRLRKKFRSLMNEDAGPDQIGELIGSLDDEGE